MRETPPELDLKKIRDVPIALFCGKTDQLASKGDYMWVREQLLDTLCYFKEFNLGHLGLLVPKDRQHFFDMLELCKAYNPDYVQSQSEQETGIDTNLLQKMIKNAEAKKQSSFQFAQFK